VNLPNGLTLFRVVLIPVLVLVWLTPFQYAGELAAFIFVIAALTDWMDGWLARRLGQESAFGAFLDPVADKLMVAAALVLLVDAFDSVLVTLSAIVIIGREIVVSALREWMSEIGQRGHVAVSWLGKVKTATQMLAIIACLALPIEQTLTHPGLWILVLAALLTLWSMSSYLKAARPYLIPFTEEPERD
jgi:CDP-diacylglycerol---glycerol-3-phosphate 3-phosphatidyltransferase